MTPLLEKTLPEIADAVVSLDLPGFAGLVLGGGYGRGEGGVTPEGGLWNDLDFFVFLDRDESEFPAFAKRLESVSARFEPILGIAVDFTVRGAARMKHDERRVMVQELLRGHVTLAPERFDLSAWSGVKERPAGEIPVVEAARLLMNRGMGLVLARGPEGTDRGFWVRNLAKAALGAGDARLIAERRYAWSLEARAGLLSGDALYVRAAEFKRKPSTAAEFDWDEVYASWRDAFDRVFEMGGAELRRRGGRQLMRWIVRRRTVGDFRTLGMDCTVRTLMKVRSALDAVASGRRCPSEVVEDWRTFN